MNMDSKEKQIIKVLEELGASIKSDPNLVSQGRGKVLSYIKDNPIVKPKFNFYLKPVAVGLLVFLFIVFAGFATVFAAKNTLPGDFLYPVKRAAEKARIVLAFKNKPVLRAEILTNRISEARKLAEKIKKSKDKNLEPKLIAVTEEIRQEVDALSKDILSEQKEKINDNINDNILFEEGSLPIQDGKKIAKIFQTDELERELKKTKEYLSQKNLTAALKSTFIVRKIISSGSTTSSIESVSSTKNILKKKINTKKFVGSVSSIKKDFGIDKLKKEPEIKTGLIRE